MKNGLVALVYTALAVFANPANADIAAANAARAGDMRKLAFHSTPVAIPDVTFQTFEGAPTSLAHYRGKYVVLNFWATWCPPCRKEMPMLSALQDARGGDRFAVVTLATGPNPKAGMQKLFDELGITNLPMHRDPQQGLARRMGVVGLPVTVILDPEGREVARMVGEAHWSDDNALLLVDALLAP